MKKTIKIIVLIIALCLTLMSCSNTKPIIGIIQYASHESLNNCYDGIIQGLLDGGISNDDYKIERLNSNTDSSVSATQARTLVAKNAKMIAAIATPSAVAAASAAKGEIPVVYCAVSDPIKAGLAGESVSNVIGSSDILDFKSQIDMIKAFVPSVKKIGVLYTVTEPNNLSQIAKLKQVASVSAIEIVEQTITNGNEIPSATLSLLAKGIDCITNLTDNTIMGSLDYIIAEAKKVNVPVFGSEIEQVTKGCLASASLDYFQLGRETGLMMAKILKGEAIENSMNFLKVDSSFLCYNSDVMKSFNLTLPTDIDIRDVK